MTLRPVCPFVVSLHVRQEGGLRHHRSLRSSRRAFRAWCLPVVVSLALLAGCKGDDVPGDRGGGGSPPVEVVTRAVASQPFTEQLVALGTVKARESVTVTAKVSEIVEAVHFDSGDTVRAGAPLVTLSDNQQRAALAEAQAAADEAGRLLKRQEELARQQLIARAQLDNQRAARDAAAARVAQIRAQLADRVVRAPFAGVLGLRQVSPGALMTPGTAIATLDALDRVWVDFPLPEAQLARAAPGQTVGGRVAAFPERRFEGTVSTIDTRLDETTRSALVRADFANADRTLRPGMLVSVELGTATRDALLVPEIAVVQVGRDSFVWRVGADGGVERTIVEIGSRSDGLAEILSGLRVGDRIVVEGTGKLRPGAKITERGADADGAAEDGAARAAGQPAVGKPAADKPAADKPVADKRGEG